jgi:hypothetical protein
MADRGSIYLAVNNEERDHDGLGGLTPAEVLERANVLTIELST